MANIDPVSLPSAAGIDYGQSDVRHFSEGDAVAVPAISNPTRHLAQRDNLLAIKLNEVVSEVNNKEQIVPLPVYRTVMPALAEEIIANLRIPAGYESRVLNAAVSSSPLSSDVELNIYWSNSFGNTTGTSVLTTSTETAGGTKFSSTGEFIVSIKNKGDVTLDIVASVTLTMRPTSAVSSALLPSPSLAPAGPPGPKGDKGDVGGPGLTGPPGSPGLLYRGRWISTPYPQSYSVNDVVTYDFAGTSGASSYVCLLPHIADGVNQPQPELTPSTFWDFIAQAGQTGSAGINGSIAPSDFRVVEFNPKGTLTFSPDFSGQVFNSVYNLPTSTLIDASGTKRTTTFTENAFISPSASPSGIAFLSAQVAGCFTGTLGISLPTFAWDDAATDYTNNSIRINVIQQGSIASVLTAGTTAVDSSSLTVDFWGTTGYTITNSAGSLVPTDPRPIWITLSGNQAVG